MKRSYCNGDKKKWCDWKFLDRIKYIADLKKISQIYIYKQSCPTYITVTYFSLRNSNSLFNSQKGKFNKNLKHCLLSNLLARLYNPLIVRIKILILHLLNRMLILHNISCYLYICSVLLIAIFDIICTTINLPSYYIRDNIKTKKFYNLYYCPFLTLKNLAI